jgi:hypothetical protein
MENVMEMVEMTVEVEAKRTGASLEDLMSYHKNTLTRWYNHLQGRCRMNYKITDVQVERGRDEVYKMKIEKALIIPDSLEETIDDYYTFMSIDSQNFSDLLHRELKTDLPHTKNIRNGR